eukprot:TRINITY_DN960_c0_g1_i5.p1 TRINITY_DN960_c0_g1~~TRINITY_DN960_c0_g1_i5.p1  ORF type:complete len:283 (+),score=41.12 TRINITY_DN960_c0_g1_i5:227-1075(+)
MSARYMNFSPSTSHSPLRNVSMAMTDQDKYLAELLSERQNISPFIQVLPHCCRLLNQEIVRVTASLGNASFLDHNGLEQGSPLPHGGLYSNGGMNMNGWPAYQSERMNMLQASPHAWHGVSNSNTTGLLVKKTVRVDVPVDKYPNFNFVGRLLGPRGNSLKRVEATTDCRVLIRGRGSIKDPAREEMMRDKPGYEHLNEPLHILVEAELPASIIDIRLMQAREIIEELLKPIDESHDLFKKQQLRELAILNGTLRDESSSLAGSLSPFNTSNFGLKRPKTQG